MSKKSSRHRVKRNQQLIEAQRLLEGHTMRGDAGYDGDSINRRNNQSIGHAYSSSDEHNVFFNADGYHSNTDTHDTYPKRQSIKEIGLNRLSSLDIAPTKIRKTTECSKIEQLKQRMNRRKERRRQQKSLKKKESQKDSTNTSIKRIESQKNLENTSTKTFISRSNKKSDSKLQMIHDHFEGNDKECLTVADTDSSQSTSSLIIDNNQQSSHKSSVNAEEVELNKDDSSVVSIELIYCRHCNKSYAPATYQKFCQALDDQGNPKCLSLRNKKRKVFNSAKMRIVNNSHLQPEEQRIVISGRKKVVNELRQKAKGMRTSKKSGKWRQQSEEFRDAMKCNRLVEKAQREGKPAHYYL